MPERRAADGREPELVSVIVPARDAEATIEDQLAALARQDYAGAWELVVVDNGSRDGTASVVRSWAEQLPRLHLVSVARGGGAAVARNVGVAASHGDFLAFCDADDVVSDHWLTALVTAGRESDMVSGTLDLGALNDDLVRAWRVQGIAADHLPPGLRFLPSPYGGNCAIWRSTLAHVGGWNADYRVLEDTELGWRVQLASYRLSFAPGAIVHYRLTSKLSQLCRKSYRDGRAEAQLFREFAVHGLPRTRTLRALRTWAGRVRRIPELWKSRAQRGAYVRVTARHAGRLVGSIRHRTLYL